MAGSNLPKKVVSEDRRLDKLSKQAGEELGALRWHWTLNEENPDRVSSEEYGRQVGRNPHTVRMSAKAYQESQSRDLDFQDAYDRVNAGADKYAVQSAYAEAAGVAIGTTRNSTVGGHADAAKAAKALAEERAERKGTSIQEEAKAAAEWIVKSRKAEQARREREKAQHTLEWIAATGELHKARAAIHKSIKHIDGVQFDGEEAASLCEAFRRLEAAMKHARLYITGEIEVDWDDELARLTGGAL